MMKVRRTGGKGRMRQKEEMLMMKNMRAVRKALAGGLCLAAAAGCGAAPGSASVPSTIEVANVEDQVISVTASEKVKVTPDIAELNLSVSSQEADAESCQTANSQAVNQVTEALKAQGVVRHIGLSTHTPALAREVLDTGLADMMMFSINRLHHGDDDHRL